MCNALSNRVLRVWEFPERIKALMWAGDPEDELVCDCCCDEHFGGNCRAAMWTSGLACKGDYDLLPDYDDTAKMYAYLEGKA
jgi:hypothetical protein